MKDINPHVHNVIRVTKLVILFVAASALVYSFIIVPIDVRAERVDCHNNALQQAQSITAQVQQQNSALEEGQQPTQVNDIAIYDTQFSLCLRSKGL